MVIMNTKKRNENCKILLLLFKIIVYDGYQYSAKYSILAKYLSIFMYIFRFSLKVTILCQSTILMKFQNIMSDIT